VELPMSSLSTGVRAWTRTCAATAGSTWRSSRPPRSRATR
jgi:hypothetical protein